MTLNSGIYRIELGNGWFYIGSAMNLRTRKNRHHNDLKRGKHSNIKMQRCWNKYNTFEFTILEECEIDDLIMLEDIYIKKHFNDSKNVNICSTAGSRLGRICSTESRAKMSAAWKLRGPVSAETRAKMSAWQIGKVLSAEHCAKMSFAGKGKIISAEQRIKLSIAGKGHIVSAETRAKIATSMKLYKQKEKLNVK